MLRPSKFLPCYVRRHKIPSLLCNFLRRLIYLVLKCNTLRFSSRFFHQIKGTAMGTLIAVNFANIFMSKFEEEMLDELTVYALPKGLRFIDDIFFIWDNDKIQGWTGMYTLVVPSLSTKFIKDSHQNLPV